MFYVTNGRLGLIKNEFLKLYRMNKYYSVVASDLRNTRREPTLMMLFIVPFIMLALIRFGLPVLIDYIPKSKDYQNIIIAFFVLLNAVFPGFILSFIFLDEKDLKLIPVLRVTPVSLKGVLLSRIVFMLLFGFLGSLLILFFNGITNHTLFQCFAIAILCALNVPFLVLFISTIAKNKVEGLTLLKLVNVTLFIPIAVFFIESNWENLLAIFPAYWVFQFIDEGINKPLVFALGVIALSGYNYIAYKYAVRNLN